MGQLCGVYRAYNRTMLNNRDPVAHRQQLIMVRTDEDDGFACTGKFVDQFINRDFGPDIDALGWFIED